MKRKIFRAFLFLTLLILLMHFNVISGFCRENDAVRGEVELSKKIDNIIEKTDLNNKLLTYSSAVEIALMGKQAGALMIKYLRGKDKYKRALAADVLGEIGDHNYADVLIEALDDREYSVKWRVIRALGLTGNRKAVPYLVKLLKDDEYSVYAAIALGKLKDPAAVKPLTELLKDDKAIYPAVAALAEIGDERALGPIFSVINKIDDLGLYYFQEDILKFGQALKPYCIISLKSDDYNYCRAGFFLLGKLEDPETLPLLIKTVNEGDRYVLMSATPILAKFRDPASKELLYNAMKKSKGRAKKIFASALGEMGDKRALEPLVQTLDIVLGWSPSPDVEALVKLGKPAVIPLIRELERNSRYSVRYAADALGRIGDKRALKPLTELFLSEKSPYDYWLYSAIGDINSKKSLNLHIRLLKNKEFEYRWYAVNNLGDLKDNRAIPVLKDVLYDRDKRVQFQACIALGRTGGVESKLALLKYINSDRGAEPLYAALGLMLLNDDSTFDVVINQFKKRIRKDRKLLDSVSSEKVEYFEMWAVSSLAGYGGLAVESLVEMLEDDSPAVRRFAGRVLSYIDDPGAYEALDRALEKGNVAAVGGGVIYFIEKGDSRAIPILLKAYEQDFDRETAVLFTASGNRRLKYGLQLYDYAGKGKHLCFSCTKGASENPKLPKWGKKSSQLRKLYFSR